ncbi:mucin-5AC isoform X2 [Strongylocentrotus purpuratus]|nr:mucin-5AC isoform X2 [Strongylocentrotus purpuratus]|eukprot:XP_011662318.1 PREDICTED: vegetative cell wall protein gp1 [Strongylocentrotus purpuratus]
MEKWMNVNDGNGVAMKHLSTRNHDNADSRRSSKSPSKSPSSPLPIMSHVPADPRKWAALHVGRWLEAVSAKYALQVNKTDFVMNGRALCLMKREGFLDRVPENGAILFEDFRRRLRQYLTACRQRVRTTYATQGNISLPGRVPHFPTPAGSGAPQMPNSSLVQPSAASPWIAPFSALRRQPGTDRKPAGVLGVPPALHTAQPPQGLQAFLHTAPFGLSNTPLVHGPSSLSNTQGIRQSSSRNDPTFLPPSQAGPSTSTSALVTAINGQYYAAASHMVGASSLHPSLPAPGQPSTAANTVQPCPLHSAPSTLHPAPSTLQTTLPTSFTTTAPRTVTTHVAPTQSASVSTSCSVHSSSPAPDPHSSPYPYLGGQCQLHPSPYYKFVPIYRTMRVVGQFQPIPYGYPRTLPPATLPTTPSEFSSQSQPGRIASPTVTLQAIDQSQALDLSTSNNKSTTRPPSADQHVPSTNDRKRMKTKPL